MQLCIHLACDLAGDLKSLFRTLATVLECNRSKVKLLKGGDIRRGLVSSDRENYLCFQDIQYIIES